MKSVSLPTTALTLLMSVSLAVGQAPDTATSLAAGGKGMAALKQAATAKKYLFVFFWNQQNPQTDQAWGALQGAAAKLAAKAEVVSIQATDPAEKALVERYDVSRAPMPLVLSVAPCGAVTKALTRIEEKELETAFVSPCTELCMKALQEQKLVLLCVMTKDVQAPAALPQAVRDFTADERYRQATEVVVCDAASQAEKAFLSDLQVDARAAKPVTVFMAPPGAVLGKFDAAATKDDLIAKLASAQSGCCPGGKCGPGGCGPKR